MGGAIRLIPRKANAIGPALLGAGVGLGDADWRESGEIGAIRRSVLSAPATLRTLLLIMREAPTGGPGPWADKADWARVGGGRGAPAGDPAARRRF